MQVDESSNVRPRSPESDPGDSDTSLGLSAKLLDKINKLAKWRIDPSSIEFSENTYQFQGGHATVSRAILNLGFGEGGDVGMLNDGEGGDGSHSNAPRTKTVAVKSIKMENEDDRERVLGLALREAGLLAELDHGNIIKLEGFAENLSKNRVWLVFPWEENGNLKDFAASQDWEIPERIWMIDDVVRGVEYLHGRNSPICHGDLKSVNVLVTAKYRAVITDFGSARRLAQQDVGTETTQSHTKAQPALEFQATFCPDTNTMTLTGNEFTLRWAAPELLLDDAKPDLWSDIWALGWIFYEVMTNLIPFEGVTKESMVIKHVIEGKLPSVADHTRMSLILKLCSLMIKCWSINPYERPTAEDCRKSMTWMPMVAPNPRRTSEEGSLGGRSPALLMKLGSMHSHQDDYMNASKFFNEALDVYTQIGDSAGRADALFKLAEVHHFRDEYNESFTCYSEVLEIRTKLGDMQGRARALRGLAKLDLDEEKYSEAVTLNTEAVEICSDIDDRNGRAEGLNGLAEVYRLQNDCSKATVLYTEVAEICADTGNKNLRAHARWGHGEVLRLIGEYTEAAALLSEALQLFTQTGDRYGMANTLLYTAHLYRDQDQHRNAISLYEKSAKGFAQIGNDSKVATALEQAADVRRKLEQVEAE